MFPSARPPARTVQQGQALPLVLVFLVVLCVGLLVTFNTEQVVSKKVELTHAADAAAYSIAIEQARARNLAAYLNRARVANEVTIAQMVSLNSWLTMAHSTSEHFEKLMKVVGILTSWLGIGEVLLQVGQVMDQLNNVLTQVRRALVIPGFNGAITGLDGMDFIYAGAAQAALSDALSITNISLMANKVVQDNAPDASLTLGGRAVLVKNLAAANDQLQLYTPGRRNGASGRTNEGGERYRNVVMASRDKFTRERKSGFLFLKSNGGTDLVDYDRWAAVDTFQFEFGVIKFPIGWGGTQAVEGRRPSFFPGINGNRGWKSPYDNKTYKAYNGINSRRLAGKMVDGDPAGTEMGFKRNEAYFTGYRHGLSPAYYDVRSEYSRTPDGTRAGPIYTVEVGNDIGKVHTSTMLGMGSDDMRLQDEARKGQIRAVASAQVYFNRPHKSYDLFRRSVWGKQDDDKFEMGSLFAPYWQARLVQTPDQDRLALMVP